MNKHVLSFIILFQMTVSNAQNTGRLAYKWSKPTSFVPIPDEFKNEDAVAIYNHTGIKNDLDVTTSINYRTSGFIKRKIRLLTAQGLKDYSNIIIKKKSSSTVTTLDARTIKKDGKTISIKSADIKLLHTYDDENDQYYDEYRIAIPGVEIGDEVEYIYTTYQNGLSWADDVYLHNDLACLESQFVLTLRRGLVTDIFSINEMASPERIDEDDYQILTWKLSNLPSIKNQNYAIVDKEFPYVQYYVKRLVLSKYNIDHQLSIENWGELYKVLSHNNSDHNNKSRGLQKYFESFKNVTDTLTKVEKVRYFVKKINEEFILMENEDVENAPRPVMYFVENKKIDVNNLRLYYKYMFYYLNIPFETCFGKNRYQGDLFPAIISTHQITHVFFYFADDQLSDHYLFVSNSDIKYNVDERAWQLENTKIIHLKKDDPFSADKPSVQIRAMPQSQADHNRRTVTCSFNISPDWTSLNCDTKVSFTGMVSLRYRTNWINRAKEYKNDTWIKWLDQEDNKKFGLDTVFIETQDNMTPFNFAVRIKSTESDIISPASDNISSLKVQIPLDHIKIPSYSYKRFTTLYMPYLYTDELNYFIQFPSNVTVINEKDLNKKLANEVGEFNLSATKISDTVYKISSVYKIRAKELVKSKYKMLVDLNDMMEQSKEFNILYKKL